MSDIHDPHRERSHDRSRQQDADLLVVIPCLNEALNIGVIVASVIRCGAVCVVCDGGSSDNTAAQAAAAGASVIKAGPGRATQMNAGAQFGFECFPNSRWLLFLHADVGLPVVNDIQVTATQATHWVALTAGASREWARFDIRLVASTGGGKGWYRWQERYSAALLPIVSRLMNWRSALTGICTGDQGLLVTREMFVRVEGFPAIALMEDIEISRRLKAVAGRPFRLRDQLHVSARRWERDGIFRTILSMWWTRLRYFTGTPPDVLHKSYYGKQ